MGRYLKSPGIKNKDFVKSRIGVEAERYWAKPDMIHKEESITMIMNQKSCDRNEAIITIEEGKNGNNDFYS